MFKPGITDINKRLIKLEIFEKDFKEGNRVKLYLEDGNIIDIMFRADYESDSGIEVKVLSP